MSGHEHSWSYALACVVVYTLCFLLCSSLGLRHFLVIWKTKKRPVKDDEETRVDMAIVNYCTNLSVALLWLLTALALAIGASFFARGSEWLPCDVLMVVYSETYALAKCAMYGVFIARLRLAFHYSVYAYTKRTIRALYAAVTIALILLVCTIPFYVSPHWEDTGHTYNGRRVRAGSSKRSMAVCVGTVNRKLIAAFALFDVVFSVLILVLFTRPLLKVFKQRIATHTAVTSRGNVSAIATVANGMDPIRLKLELLPLKYTLLSATAIVSTFFAAVLMAIMNMAILAPIDNVVNMACLLAMTTQWEGCYWRVCGPPLRCVSKAPCVAERNRVNIVGMSSVIRQRTNSENL